MKYKKDAIFFKGTEEEKDVVYICFNNQSMALTYEGDIYYREWWERMAKDSWDDREFVDMVLNNKEWIKQEIAIALLM